MMICFNCSAATRDELDQLVTLGGYRDYDEAITLAIRNQLLMEKQVAASGAIIVGVTGNDATVAHHTLVPSVETHRSDSDSGTAKSGFAVPPRVASTSIVKPTAKPKTAQKRSTANGKPHGNSAATEVMSPGPPQIPAIFGLEGFPSESPDRLADISPGSLVSGQRVPLERWVLGQQNRLLPAKANSRALIRLYLESGKELPLAKTADRLAREAARLGDYLVALDKRRETSRDDALAIAFPTSGDDSGKSRTRYANQFVAYQNARNEVSGLLADLKLIEVVRHKEEPFLVPTKMAWCLARLPNPVIDTPDEQVAGKFSQDERILLTAHILQSVPAEVFAYRAVLEAIDKGNNTPEKMDTALKTYVTPDRTEEFSQSFLSSQRSGAVSRMSDLNLVARQREGIRMSYSLTEEGRAFLSQGSETAK